LDAEAEAEAEADAESDTEIESESEDSEEAEESNEETDESEATEESESESEESIEVEDTTDETDAAVEQSETEQSAEAAAATTTEEEAAPTTDAVTEADGTVSRFAEVNTDSETEAEAVESLQAAKWGEHTVEADELSAFDKLMARHASRMHGHRTKKFKKACVKGDAVCLKKAQEEEVKRLTARLAKLTNKPTILRPPKPIVKRIPKRPEFLTPVYKANNDFVNPEYLIPKAQKRAIVGLPVGWSIPALKRKIRRSRK